MSGNRKAAESEILTWIDRMCPGSDNTKLYKAKFAGMDDAAFEQFINDLDSEKVQLAIVSPNFGANQLDTGRNLQLAKELGHNFFPRIQVPAKNGMPAYITPVRYLVADFPLRRQAQILDKKISIPEDNNSVDNFTGQVTGASKGSRISYPEVQVLAALGLDKSLTEFLKYRGGDERGFNAMNTMIGRTGGVSMDAIAPYAGTVRSTHTLNVFLTGMHLRPIGLVL